MYAFIGAGNMGGALARALCKTLPAQQVILYDILPEKARALAEELGCIAASDAAEAVSQADYVMLGVKPQMMKGAMEKIAPHLRDNTVLITMAAGPTMDSIQRMAGREHPVIRIMPNTPALVGEGMILYTTNELSKGDCLKVFLHDLAAAGRFMPLEERLIDAGSSVSGCGPAFADLFLEALADGAVACGMPRAQALELAAQTLVGSGRLALEGEHPGVLKDRVCSPAGTTIQGVRALEKGAFRSAVMEAVIAAYERTLALRD